MCPKEHRSGCPVLAEDGREARWLAAENQVLEHVAFEKEYMLCRCTQVQRTATWRVFSREMFISAE